MVENWWETMDVSFPGDPADGIVSSQCVQPDSSGGNSSFQLWFPMEKNAPLRYIIGEGV